MPDQIPLPRSDPRTMQSLIDALLAQSKPPAGIPLPRPDPRDWMERAVVPQAASEDYSKGAIHPDAMMKNMGIPPGSGVDNNEYADPAISSIFQNSIQGKQRPMSAPPPIYQQDAGNGLFGVPQQHLQQMAGDVIPMPKGDYDLNREKAKLFEGMEPGSILDKMYPKAPVIPFPTQHLSAAKPVDQNLPKLPQSGFVPSLSPMYMNDKGLGAPPVPNQPPIFWQPG